MEVEYAELSKELELSNRRVKDMQESLAASSSNQASLDSSDYEVDDELYVFYVFLKTTWPKIKVYI